MAENPQLDFLNQKQQYHITNSRRSKIKLSNGCLAYEKIKKNEMGIRVLIIPHCRKNVKLRFSLQKNPHLMTNFQHFLR